MKDTIVAIAQYGVLSRVYTAPEFCDYVETSRDYRGDYLIFYEMTPSAFAWRYGGRGGCFKSTLHQNIYDAMVTTSRAAVYSHWLNDGFPYLGAPLGENEGARLAACLAEYKVHNPHAVVKIFNFWD